MSSQVHQVFAPWLQNTVRLYANASTVELEYTVGPVPFEDGLGKEIVSVWSTGTAASCLVACNTRRHRVGADLVYRCERSRYAKAETKLPPHLEAQCDRSVRTVPKIRSCRIIDVWWPCMLLAYARIPS